MKAFKFNMLIKEKIIINVKINIQFITISIYKYNTIYIS